MFRPIRGQVRAPGQKYDRLHDVEAGVEGSGGGPLVEDDGHGNQDQEPIAAMTGMRR